MGTFITLVRECKLVNFPGGQFDNSYKNYQRDGIILLLGIHPVNIFTHVDNEVSTRVFMAALCVAAKGQN